MSYEILRDLADARVRDGKSTSRERALLELSYDSDPVVKGFVADAMRKPDGARKQAVVAKTWKRTPESDAILEQAEKALREERASSMPEAIALFCSANPMAYLDYARSVQGEKPSWRR